MRTNILVAACVMLAATACFAQPLKLIRLRDGRVLEGRIVERTDKIIKVRMKLGELSFPADQVVAVDDAFDPRGEYDKRLAAVDKTSPVAQVALGQWAMEQGFLREAKGHFQAALALQKDNERAALLLRQVEAKLAGQAGSPEAPPVSTDTPKVAELKDLLRMEDIYRIRQAELRDGETVSVDFRNDAVDRFIKGMHGVDEFRQAGFERLFKGRTPSWQARYMLRHLAEDSPLRDDILIKSDPDFMRDYRLVVWRFVGPSCATSPCHGSQEGRGGLKLYNLPGQHEQADYTNFLILSNFYNTKTLARTIDRDHPEMSLLLQYALPPEQAEYKHPKKTSPAFGNRGLAGFQATLRWIRSLEKLPHYDIRNTYPYVMPRSRELPGIRTSKPTTTSAPGMPARPF